MSLIIGDRQNDHLTSDRSINLSWVNGLVGTVSSTLSSNEGNKGKTDNRLDKHVDGLEGFLNLLNLGDEVIFL